MKNQIQKTTKISKNLTLTGMMGVGKSTIGKNLAKKLKYNFFDTDKLIEAEEGASINSIFKNKSEIYFRKLESKVTLQAQKTKNSVIALGGGAFLNKSIRSYSKKTSISFWLDIDLGILTTRLIKTNKRPLLNKKNNIRDVIKQIYVEREKIYSQADFRIKCNFLKTNDIVNKILKLYEKSSS
jgi:shikimate kinase|tara:strand:- start:1941 stop:2489 length:549 start_codon:yes stop_codon:yes gene_type:complete